VTGAARLFAAALLAGAASQLAAQAQDDPVRLDDFAVGGSSSRVLQVPQVSSPQAEVTPEPQPADRTIATQPRSKPAAAVAQLPGESATTAQAQLSAAGAKPDESFAAVSSRAQSKPQGTQRLTGTDRCDPQLGHAELARCQRILELRAQEFHAPAPPELSAEQKVLAAQQADEADQARHSTDTRLRLAARDEPDADLQSNQELASLYFEPNSQPPEAAPDKAEPQGDASLSQVLEALQAAASGGQGNP
jgi:hypothetical protein